MKLRLMKNNFNNLKEIGAKNNLSFPFTFLLFFEIYNKNFVCF